MDPLRFLTGAAPQPLAALREYSSRFRAMSGLVGWWTLEPVFFTLNENRVVSVDPRVGKTKMSAVAGSTGPVRRDWNGVPGTKFTTALPEFLSPEINFDANAASAAVLVRLDGVTKNPIRTAFSWTASSDRTIRVSRASGTWSAHTLADPVKLPYTAEYQLIIAEIVGGTIAMRASNEDGAHAVVSAPLDAVTELREAPCQLIVGNTGRVSYANAWDDGISEVWAFNGSILNNPTRLNAIDTYVKEVYFGG